MTPMSRSGTLNSGMPLEDGSWVMADGDPASGESGGWSPPSPGFGATGMEDGVCGSVAAGKYDEKPIFKGVCAAGEMCGVVAGDSFNVSGKLGSAGAEISGAR